MTLSADHMDVAIRPSRWHAALLAVVHLLALVALALSGVQIWLAVALGVAVLASFAYTLRRFAMLRDARSVVRVEWRADGWRLALRSGESVTAHLESSVVLGWLVVMNFRDATRTHFPVTVLPDSVDADAFRRLRVLLGYGGRPG